jgi:hypothetical protein
VVISDAAGTFQFSALPAGAYTLSATRSGFASADGRAEATTLTLSTGQHLTAAQVALVPGGVIFGRLLDEDGTPFAGATVEALAARTENGQRAFVSIAAATTDDRGMFRLHGLPAGKFFVSAFDPAFTNVADATGPLRFTPTYFPGVALPQDARAVSVAPGSDPEPIEFKLRIVRPATVSGTISPVTNRPLLSGAVIMSATVYDGLGAVASQDVEIRPDGTFTFRNVPPGQYQIRARGLTDPQGPALFATYGVTVEGQDIDNVALTLTPGATVEGIVTFEAERTPKPASFPGLRVRVPLADGSQFGDALTGDVLPNGRFRIRGVMAGTHYFSLEGLPDPWVIKSIVFRGRDIADGPLDIVGPEDIRDVRIVVTDAATEVQGSVRSGGRTIAEALVVAFSAAPQFWTFASRRVRTARTDASGRYHLRGLPPGAYHVAATMGLDESEVARVTTLQKLLPMASTLSLKEREKVDLDLNVVRLATTPAVVR